MVRSFQSDDGKYTALYASMLVSIFTFCEFLSNIPWAWVADRIGRKNTLLIGIIGSIVSATLFGLSRNMVLATISRAIGGLMNPNVGVVQTCIGELAKKEQQGQMFKETARSGSLFANVTQRKLSPSCHIFVGSGKFPSIWCIT